MARMQGINQRGHVSSSTLSGFIAQAIMQNLPVPGVGAVSKHQKNRTNYRIKFNDSALHSLNNQ
jgi:hypothetical protein